MADGHAFLAFAHIGDLHISDDDPAHAETFETVAAQINAAARRLAFVFLPGDNANNGLPAQYARIRAVLDRLTLPFHVIAGDHDMEGGSLEAFYAGLGVPRLPYGIDAGGVRCLFLDMSGPGTGGPDFTLGAQADWLQAELHGAKRTGLSTAVFMHSYPADLRGDGEAAQVAALLHHGPVRLVEMGHTHYNELGNDGRTVYAAARSTGQIEEGPPGFAVATIDAGVVSWRFKELGHPWPFVIVTSPADRRLAHDSAHLVTGETAVRALVLGLDEGTCELSADGGPWRAMQPLGGGRWQAMLPYAPGGRELRVRASADGHQDVDTIELASGDTDIPTSKGIGSDKDSVGAWPVKGLLGTQLGPNRNGRAW